MDGGVDSRFDKAELTTALETFVRAEGSMAPETLQSLPIDDDAWFVLAESEDFVAVATGKWSARGPGDDGGVLKLKRTGSGWTHAAYGDCRPGQLRRVLPEGHSWVEISALGALDRRSSEIVVGLSELNCSSGRDPRPHLREPSIVEDEDSVTISWTTKAVLVGNCMGAMPVPQQVQLKAPLGDRVLLDGSHWPARAVPEGP